MPTFKRVDVFFLIAAACIAAGLFYLIAKQPSKPSPDISLQQIPDFRTKQAEADNPQHWVKTEKVGNIILHDGKVDCNALVIQHNNGSNHRFYVAVDAEEKNSPAFIHGIWGILDCFEVGHPDLKITSWSINESFPSHLYKSKLYGIWINCEPKVKN